MNFRAVSAVFGAWVALQPVVHAAIITVTTTNDSGPGSLRQAISDANISTNLDYIYFNIPGAGTRTISVGSALPTITTDIVIDGFTQPGASANTSPTNCNAVLRIELNGTNAGAGVDGLILRGSKVTVRGLVINRFSGRGINAFTPVQGILQSVVEGCYIGTDSTGTVALPNGEGLIVQGLENIRIGGPTLQARNIISGNTGHGIETGTGAILPITFTIQGNFIGVDASGVAALGNGGDGINFGVNGGNGVIGGAAPSAGNVISANGGNGIYVSHRSGVSAAAQGNAIGTDLSGLRSLGNGGLGVRILGFLTQLGGTAPGEGNLILRNLSGGVVMQRYSQASPDYYVPMVGNSIMSQAGLDLNLQDGTFPRLEPDNTVTPNDVGDGDSGPNGYMNFPVLTGISNSAGVFTISGTLNSLASNNFSIDFYRSPTGNASGYGGGKYYVGRTNVMTDGSGNATFAFITSESLVGQVIAATTTSGGTSEFSLATNVPGTFPGNFQFKAGGYLVAENAGSASIDVVRTEGSIGAASVTYFTSDGSATASSDYVATSNILAFADGETNKTFTVPIIDDTSGKSQRSFFVSLANPTDGAALGLIRTAPVYIQDNDPLPAISVNDVSVTEGNSGAVFAIFTVSLSMASSQTVSVAYFTADDTAIGGSDYVAQSGVIQFAPGETQKPITITVNGDTTPEANERFTVNLLNPTNATIANVLGVGTILDDDTPPAISINDISGAEGNSGLTAFVFTLSLSRSAGAAVQVDFSTAPGSATSGVDYQPTNGTVTFAPGQTNAAVVVNVIGDLQYEGNETFFLNLSNAVNATIADAQGMATIIEDDPPPPTISINDISVFEGDSGSTFSAFAVSLSSNSSLPVTVNFATSNGTAVAGSDYLAASGTLNFNPGEVIKPITVTIKGDTNAEPNETFFVNLSSPSNAVIAKAQGVATVLNDDPLVLSIGGDVSYIFLSWPGSSEGFSLYFATNLASPVQWFSVSSPVTTTNGSNLVVEPPTGPLRIYRLQSP